MTHEFVSPTFSLVEKSDSKGKAKVGYMAHQAVDVTPGSMMEIRDIPKVNPVDVAPWNSSTYVDFELSPRQGSGLENMGTCLIYMKFTNNSAGALTFPNISTFSLINRIEVLLNGNSSPVCTFPAQLLYLLWGLSKKQESYSSVAGFLGMSGSTPFTASSYSIAAGASREYFIPFDLATGNPFALSKVSLRRFTSVRLRVYFNDLANFSTSATMGSSALALVDMKLKVEHMLLSKYESNLHGEFPTKVIRFHYPRYLRVDPVALTVGGITTVGTNLANVSGYTNFLLIVLNATGTTWGAQTNFAPTGQVSQIAVRNAAGELIGSTSVLEAATANYMLSRHFDNSYFLGFSQNASIYMVNFSATPDLDVVTGQNHGRCYISPNDRCELNGLVAGSVSVTIYSLTHNKLQSNSDSTFRIIDA